MGKTGIELIADERQRQIDQEGWSLTHDDEHDEDSLAQAASVYAQPADCRHTVWRTCGTTSVQLPEGWPWGWGPDSYKPTPDDRVRELVRAGALIAAEIDRLQRAQERAQAPQSTRHNTASH